MGIPGLHQFVDRAEPAIGRGADWRENSPPSSKAEVLLVDGYAVMYHVFNQTYDGKAGLGFPLKACGGRMSQVRPLYLFSFRLGANDIVESSFCICFVRYAL